jgi:hypothetical protein
MIGFEWTAAKFFWYLFFGYFTLLYFTFYGMMAVGITPNHHIASIVSSAFYLIWNLFSGFIVPRPVILFLTSIFIYFSSFLADILSSHMIFRVCPSGGGGTAGHAPWHGHCTAWWCHSLATS